MQFNWNAQQSSGYSAQDLLNLELLQQILDLTSNHPRTKEIIIRFNLKPEELPNLDELDELFDETGDLIDEQTEEVDLIITNIPAPYHRDYDSESVALKCCGVWVGWTRYSGGDRYGDPYKVDPKPYFLTVIGQKIIETVDYTFVQSLNDRLAPKSLS